MNGPAATHGMWADLWIPDLALKDADFAVFGVPYDGAASARRGAAQAPEHIRFWSSHLTPFGEDRTSLKDVRVADLGDIQVTDQVRDFERIYERVASLSNIPIILGGDHSITIPVFKGQVERYRGQRLGVLWLDAHPDLCDVFTGSRFSHACVLRRGLEFGLRPEEVCLVGLRSWEDQEIDLIENGRMNIYTAAEVSEHGMKGIAASVRSKLSDCDAVHISLDIDCLDPAYAPGTGIPEAGGLTSRDVLTLVKALQGLPLVGLDVVEVAPPIDPGQATVFAALRFVMEFIAVYARQKQK